MTREQIEERITLAFQKVFGVDGGLRSPEQLTVLAKLRQLARPNKSLFSPHESDRTLAMRSGRMEMWEEIDKRCGIAPPTLQDLLGNAAEHSEED